MEFRRKVQCWSGMVASASRTIWQAACRTQGVLHTSFTSRRTRRPARGGHCQGSATKRFIGNGNTEWHGSGHAPVDPVTGQAAEAPYLESASAPGTSRSQGLGPSFALPAQPNAQDRDAAARSSAPRGKPRNRQILTAAPSGRATMGIHFCDVSVVE